MMLTNVRLTSLNAYTEIKYQGVSVIQKAKILTAIKHGKDYSLQELCVLTGLAINAISGRVHELKKLEILMEGDTRKCTLTGRTIHPVQFSPTQLDLLKAA